RVFVFLSNRMIANIPSCFCKRMDEFLLLSGTKIIFVHIKFPSHICGTIVSYYMERSIHII
ncbi:MAG: hypothetical protein PHG06_13910, partial [Parabacteroides sp.]|nr:hypothetical protein [Parabacteroides sp.]